MHCPRRQPMRVLGVVALLAATCAAGIVTPTASAADSPSLRFAPEAMVDWEPHSFNGRTRYQLVTRDGRAAVRAECDGGTGSGLVLRRKIDLRATPVVAWRWRVDAVYSGLDPHSQSGDDYPARLYVVDEHSVLRWRTRAINYVWANSQPQGSDWPNPFTDKAHMVAVASGAPTGNDGWHTAKRNIRADFERFHDRELDSVNAVAIMTDCDNAGQSTEAWYGAIRFLPAAAR